jgi:ribosomal silencing factor RsfS
MTVRRRLCLPRRCICCTTASVVHGAQRSPQPQEDFFVDIDSLAGFSEAAEHACGSSAKEHLDPAAQSSVISTSVSSPDVLGVIRHVPEDEDARYSRLQVPLPPSSKDGEAGAVAGHLRSNTRAGLGLGEEAAYADHSVGPVEREAAAAESSFGGSVDPAAEVKKQDGENNVAAANTNESSRLPDPAHLPYDDERFAEMLLEMEVNGVIDETWQDANKAHVEDVKEIADILTSLKVRDICCIDVSEKTASFDYMMFGTCEGSRHIHLAAWAAQDADKVQRISKIKRKQTDELWEVVPIGRIVLNLMVESFREEMSLERKWAVTRTMDPLAAANAPISEGRQVKAHGLWTLTLNLQDLEDFEVDYCKDVLMRQL